jgi:hypothetical protein
MMKEKVHDWPDAAVEMARALAIMLSLDLWNHPSAQHHAHVLCNYWEHSGQHDKATRLRKGDISDLLPIIKQIEAEHRAWVAEDPKKRRFGPPSPLDTK